MWRLFVLAAILPLWIARPYPVQAGDKRLGEPCVTPVAAQPLPYTVETDQGVIECLTINEVTATFSNTVPVYVDLHIGGQRWQQMDRYQIQIDQWREGNDIYIAIYRQIRPSGTPTLIPYATTVRLDDAFEPGSVQVHVNQYTVEIAVPDAPPPGADMPPYTPPSGDHLVRSYATIQSVEVLTQARRPILRVRGYEVTCPAPLQVDQRLEGNWVFVEIYRLQDPSCLAQRTRLDETIELDWELYTGSYVVQVNNFITTLDFPTPVTTRAYATIDYVEVLTSGFYPGNLILHVTGFYSQSCQGFLQIDHWQSRNRVTVEIYQLVNPAIMCPEMAVRLDEYIPIPVGRWIDGGSITIQVNDYVLTYPLYRFYPPDPIYPVPQ